ncbi:VOC family protein [Neolewinella aurantiaca]|uniref:VOC family protein n=1 Tax=Neolewinella aurantiaca TaxID=2602767 RepID=A0A5C7FIT8_9BACT|nr:VOC family protein [Neolewinella aurantiaca]TXF90518.1 VOC family protein [Neolewinella aurantiaca]
MNLGAFSVSLSVKDLAASRKFYEALGFSVFAGEADKNYHIMKNGNALIGIFQGMFEGNILTFNPGWDENADPLSGFPDIREIQAHLQSEGIELTATVDPEGAGPGRVMVKDPDGNIVLLDQHV